MRNSLWLDEGFPERNKIFGEYLPRIGAATGSERRALLCELATALTDADARTRIQVVTTADQFELFKTECGLILSRFLMPRLRHQNLDDETVQAMVTTIASRVDYWVGEMAIQLTENSAGTENSTVAADPPFLTFSGMDRSFVG